MGPGGKSALNQCLHPTNNSRIQVYKRIKSFRHNIALRVHIYNKINKNYYSIHNSHSVAPCEETH